MTENKEELLPCPFCGGEAKFKSSIFNNDDKKSLGNVHCVKCYASTGGDLQIYEQAIENWNTRATPKIVWPWKRSDWDEYDTGWEACIDELARLNPWMKGASNEKPR